MTDTITLKRELVERLLARLIAAWCPKETTDAIAAALAAPQPQPNHVDLPSPGGGDLYAEDHAVDRFAAHMKWKLANARARGRFGWDDPNWTPEMISQALREHVEKGDPVDVANYCMFLSERQEPISTHPAQEPVWYQYRMRPSWYCALSFEGWLPCTKEEYEDYIRVPILNDWEHQARALYAAPVQPVQSPPPVKTRETCAQCRPYRDATGELVLPLCRCKPATPTQPVQSPPPDDFSIRGKLTALKCWHRLTKDEAEDLVSFFAIEGIKP